MLGLLAVEFDDPRQKRDLLESGLDRRRPDAARDRVAPHPGEKLIEVAPRRRRDPAPQRHREQRSRREQCPAARAERHHRHAPAVKLSQSPSAIRPDPLQPRTARRFSLRPVFREQRYRIWSFSAQSLSSCPRDPVSSPRMGLGHSADCEPAHSARLLRRCAPRNDNISCHCKRSEPTLMESALIPISRNLPGRVGGRNRLTTCYREACAAVK